MERHVVASYAACRGAVARGPRTVRLAVSLLPADVRDDASALYALARTLQALVEERDAGSLTTDEARAGLRFWRDWFEAGCWDEIDDPVAAAIRYTILAREIPAHLFLHFADAVENDLAYARYRTTDELIRYCYRSASTMSIATAHASGLDDPAVHARAAELGVAARLTMVIRDVGEALAHDRLYLPLEEMDRHHVGEAHLQAKVITRGYRQLIDELSTVADAYFGLGLAGLDGLPRASRRSAHLVAGMNREILRAVKRNGYDNLTRRAGTPMGRSLLVLARSYISLSSAPAPALPDALPAGESLVRGEGPRGLSVLPDAS